MEPITVKVLDVAIVVVTTGMLTGVWAVAKKRYKLMDKRDALLDEVHATLQAVREDNKCQYTALLAVIDAQELQLHSLKGKKLNGNIDEALERIRTAKAQIQAHLADVGCK